MLVYLAVSIALNLVLLGACGYMAYKMYKVASLLDSVSMTIKDTGQKLDATVEAGLMKIQDQLKSWVRRHL